MLVSIYTFSVLRHCFSTAGSWRLCLNLLEPSWTYRLVSGQNELDLSLKMLWASMLMVNFILKVRLQGLSHYKLLLLRLGFKAVFQSWVMCKCFTCVLCLLQVQKMCSILLCGIWRLKKGTQLQLTCRWQPITAQLDTTHALCNGSATAFPLSKTSSQMLMSKPDVCCCVRGFLEINVHVPQLTKEFCCERS